VPSRFLQGRYLTLNISLRRKAETQDFTDRKYPLRMLSPRGNPTLKNIGLILQAVQKDLGFAPQVTIAAA
jgi:hypothetical protein